MAFICFTPVFGGVPQGAYLWWQFPAPIIKYATVLVLDVTRLTV